MTTDQHRRRYDQCDDTCTTDCGHCKGQGRPSVEDARAVVWDEGHRTGCVYFPDCQANGHHDLNPYRRAASRAVPSDPPSIPTGTPVRYWPGDRSGEGTVSRTRSVVWNLGDGTPVVAVEGYPGGIALTHVEVLPAVPSDHTATTEYALHRAVGVYALEKDRGASDLHAMRRALTAARDWSFHTVTTEDADPAAQAITDYLASYTLPANYGRPSNAGETHRDVAKRCGPLIASHLHNQGLLATARPDTTTEWGVRLSDGRVARVLDAQAAHELRLRHLNAFVVRREVTAWTEADRG